MHYIWTKRKATERDTNPPWVKKHRAYGTPQAAAGEVGKYQRRSFEVKVLPDGQRPA